MKKKLRQDDIKENIMMPQKANKPDHNIAPSSCSSFSSEIFLSEAKKNESDDFSKDPTVFTPNEYNFDYSNQLEPVQNWRRDTLELEEERERIR